MWRKYGEQQDSGSRIKGRIRVGTASSQGRTLYLNNMSRIRRCVCACVHEAAYCWAGKEQVSEQDNGGMEEGSNNKAPRDKIHDG